MFGAALTLLMLVLLMADPALSQAPWSVRPYARIASTQVRELSGLARSGRLPGVMWGLNDSGDVARVFAIHQDGTVVTPDGLAIAGARNVDWEDLTIDGDTLYIADMGNNVSVRRDLGVYIVKEPDPTRPGPVTGVTHLAIAYPDQVDFPPTDRFTFDCESVFAIRGRLFFITKHRDGLRTPGRDANLYRLDTRDTERVNVLTKVDHHPDLGGFVTSAAVSPDGRTLAVLVLNRRPVIWLFEATAPGDQLFQTAARRLEIRDMKQAEAITFQDDATLIVGNEQNELYRVPVQRFSRVAAR